MKFIGKVYRHRLISFRLQFSAAVTSWSWVKNNFILNKIQFFITRDSMRLKVGVGIFTFHNDSQQRLRKEWKLCQGLTIPLKRCQSPQFLVSPSRNGEALRLIWNSSFSQLNYIPKWDFSYFASEIFFSLVLTRSRISKAVFSAELQTRNDILIRFYRWICF